MAARTQTELTLQDVENPASTDDRVKNSCSQRIVPAVVEQAKAENSGKGNESSHASQAFKRQSFAFIVVGVSFWSWSAYYSLATSTPHTGLATFALAIAAGVAGFLAIKDHQPDMYLLSAIVVLTFLAHICNGLLFLASAVYLIHNVENSNKIVMALYFVGAALWWGFAFLTVPGALGFRAAHSRVASLE